MECSVAACGADGIKPDATRAFSRKQDFMIAKLLKYSLAAAAFGLAAQDAVAATTINVQLTDTGLDHPMAKGLAYKTAGASPAKATAMIKLSQATAAAGPVTFNV